VVPALRNTGQLIVLQAEIPNSFPRCKELIDGSFPPHFRLLTATEAAADGAPGVQE
jgi:hypothetical protein